VFEIGSTLRDARRRRGLELVDCERATRIRARHLAAIEEERWDRLPEPVYVRAFLRTYAGFLEVDPRLVLDEFDSRQPPAEEEPEVLEPSRGPLDAAVRRLVAPRPRPRRRRVGLVWISVGALGVLALVIWLGASRGGTPTVSLPPSASAPAPPTRAPVAAAAAPRPHRARAAATPAESAARGVTLTVAGLGERGSWVSVRRTANGPVLWEGTLAGGKRRRWTDPRELYVRVGWTPRVGAWVNGRPLHLTGGTASFVIDRSGERPA
jgi:cytoskeletal protein RodZ